jgi:hypothetical protein
MVLDSHKGDLTLFLDRGINVIAWNYRGYGRSTGSPSPNNLKLDVEAVREYVVKKLGFIGKLGVYGRSLGGIPSSYLANKVQMAIVDRSFSNFKDMARHKYFGIAAWWLFNVGNCGWQIESDFDFSKKSESLKVIMQDKKDEIIDIRGSLMAGVANEIMKSEKS